LLASDLALDSSLLEDGQDQSGDGMHGIKEMTTQFTKLFSNVFMTTTNTAVNISTTYLSPARQKPQARLCGACKFQACVSDAIYFIFWFGSDTWCISQRLFKEH